MSRRVLGLYAIMAFAWGIPYFFIKVVVEELPPAGMVAVRTAMAAALLVPIAWRNGTLRAAARVWPWVLLFAVLEFAAPWYFLGVAEQRISSSLTGLLLATVPLIATVIGRLLGDRHVTDWRRLLGLVIGFAGVGILLGVDNEWAYRAIKAVGNYGEIYDRYFGPNALGLPRGLNKLWTDGGLQYPWPFR